MGKKISGDILDHADVPLEAALIAANTSDAPLKPLRNDRHIFNHDAHAARGFGDWLLKPRR